MKFKKILTALLVPVIVFSTYGLCLADYISTTVAVSGVGYKSLEKAYKQARVTPPLNSLGLTTFFPSKYHMTLMGFDIHFVNQMVPAKQKQYFKRRVEQALRSASTKAVKNTLAYLKAKTGKTTPVILKFKNFEVFKKKLVAVFSSNVLFDKLVDAIEKEFRRLFKDSRIAFIRRHQLVVKPHIAVGNIAGFHNYFGQTVPSRVRVAPFHISNPRSIVSVQWR